MIEDTVKKTSLALEKTVFSPAHALMIRDTSDMSGLSKVLDRDYGELFRFIEENGLKPGKVMAFYLNFKDPITLEAAVEVDRMPAQLSGRIEHKIIEGGNAVVAHYRGPYEQLEKAYNEIAVWLNENHEQARELPFEVYLNKPSEVKDKYELKTDVYQLLN